MSQGTLNLSASSADAVITPSNPAEVPLGFDIGGAQVVSVFANYNGATVRAFLEGSNDELPTNWTEVVDAEASFTADGVGMLDTAAVADQNQVVAFGQFRWVRLNYVFTGAVPVGAGSIGCRIASPGSAGTGNPQSPA